ncbi:MAG: hypothetical protein CMO55_15640 [Verrucomicrobiales bacterium]|nr:hypothetical protein [Verrucomicrobiales bacterium]
MKKAAGTAVIASLLSLCAPLWAAERVALVIGVDQYQELPAAAQLQVAVRDASLIANTLKSLPDPFSVNLLTNPDRESISQAFDSFIEEATNAECAVVYFAGHGIEFHGENYLLVKDTKFDARSDETVRRVKERLYFDSLPMQKVLDDLDETEANLKLVILDACRDNPIEIEGPNGTRSLAGSKSGLGRVTAPSGMLISYSADAGEQANDGLFTEILSNHIQMPGRSIMEVFAMTRAEVRKQAGALAAEGRGVLHEPAEYSKLDPSALSFSFRPGPITQAPKPKHMAAPSTPGQTDAVKFQSQKEAEVRIKLAEVNAKMDSDRKRYNDALNVINTLTHNKRRPVREGSPEYHKCVAASNIIGEIERSAPELIEEKQKLEAVLKTLGVPIDRE